jgi:hypothetical protein
MTLDDHIQLAEQIANKLPEVSRNEWMRWMQVAQTHGLRRAIKHAERLSSDITLRPAIQRANRLIAQAMADQLSTLERLAPREREVVLGYVSGG